MHRRIDNALHRLRQDLTDHLNPSAIHRICKQLGHVWRDCLLTPCAIVHWLLVQVLHGNTALNHITLQARRGFSDAAYCQARARLPLAVLQAILRHIIKALVPTTEAEGRWRGHRTFLIDGSSFSMADDPVLREHFGQPGNQKPGCGFPVAKILALFHAGTGLLLHVVAAPLRTHEMAQADSAHPALRPGDVLVGDRGLGSFAHLALLLRRGAHGLFRIHQKQIVDFTPHRPHARPGDKQAKGRPRSRWLRALGAFDQVVEWFQPQERPEWMTAEQYAALSAMIPVREVRYTIARRGFRTRVITLVTTLLDAELYPAEALAELYFSRWRVEQYLRDLKQTMKMDVLRCKSVDGVLKELTAYAIVYNLVRVVMGEAARRQGVDVERISFVDALRWLLEAQPGEEMPELVVNPSRPGRVEPRVRKRRPKQFPVMKQPRSVLRNRLMTQEIAA